MNSNNHPVFTEINASGVNNLPRSEPTKSTGGLGWGVRAGGWGRGNRRQMVSVLVILPLPERGAVLIQLKTPIGFGSSHFYTKKNLKDKSSNQP